MVMVVTNDEGFDINGRVGGDIYRSDQCGKHIQREPRMIMHWSDKQKKWMRSWSIAYSYWKDCINFGWGGEWTVYAQNHPTPNRKGEMIYLFASNWWMKINVYRIFNGLDILWHPPDD